MRRRTRCRSTCALGEKEVDAAVEKLVKIAESEQDKVGK
jgi:hypothetical protein